MFTKTEDMKKKWVEDIQRTISNLTLADYNLGNHRLELTTFHSPTYCTVCKNLLWGLINQGYVCKGCQHTCHKECIEKSPVCKSSKSKKFDNHPSFVHSSRYPSLTKQVSEPVSPNSPPLPPRGRNKSEPVIPNLSLATVVSTARFHGHAPGKKSTLVFDAGEEIDVLQRSDPEWWEGKSKRTGKVGFFPSNHVEVFDEKNRKGGPLQRSTTKYVQSSDIPPTTPEEATVVDEDLSMHKWFVGKIDRDEAKELLEKTNDGTFLVRESSTAPGQYALSLRHKYNVKHIKIVVSNGMFCVTALKLFPSIVSMIDYYRNNTLGVSFPGLDTCLTRGINEKRRESKSQGLGFAKVKFDYDARDPREISIKKQSKILIINKDGDWWKGENSEGQVGFFPSNFVKMLEDDDPGR